MPTVVITSINPPSEAVVAYSRISDVKVTMVGDRKTPSCWQCSAVNYLPLDQHKRISAKLDKLLPIDHYSRKMVGYLHAANEGADFIIDTDDDNIPKANWGFPDFEDEYDVLQCGAGFVNIYSLFTDQLIWPRGLPLDLIKHRFTPEMTLKKCKVGVWQGLADGDPDVDAIYRLVWDRPCIFDDRSPIVLPEGVICPFNSQNTAIRRDLFPLLYLPAHVTFRFTDILRGLVAQPIMWAHGYSVGFTTATVFQKRNPHDYMKDFVSEVPMYTNADRIVDCIAAVISDKNSIRDNMMNAYQALASKDIVCEAETILLDAWLSEL